MGEYKVGLTAGKFAPLHKGHQYLIETALLEVDELIIFIYNADETNIPLNIRANWLRELYPQAIIFEAWDGPQEIGRTSTIQKIHEQYIISRLNGKKITHFYSSEFYGEHMSEALGAINRLVDPKREKFPVSGTKIRENPYKWRNFINPIVYRDLITKVVFLGAPSTGKSTITQKLVEVYNTVYMPEYGREYWEKYHVNRRLTPEQLLEIAKGHIEREDLLISEANEYLFVDTNAQTTYMFSAECHGFVLPELEQLARDTINRYDIVFLCSDDIPYEDTWDRSGNVKRKTFQEKIIADLKERDIHFFILEGTIEQRVKYVDQILENFKVG